MSSPSEPHVSPQSPEVRPQAEVSSQPSAVPLQSSDASTPPSASASSESTPPSSFPPAPSESSEPPRASSSQPRILLAEDDDELRWLIALTLRSSGFEVVEFPDGASLVEWLARDVEPHGAIEGVDLILTDVNMPGFTAIDMLVGAHKFIGSTPVVLITAFGDTQTHERALQLGARAVLDKPVRLNDLYATISRLLPRPPPAEPDGNPFHAL